ncbi:MAG TPA: VWA domain-containing protein, partial [Anaerolineae bacterium]|nr:VWA domain-containing protein [Anaerolineae bacterium]
MTSRLRGKTGLSRPITGENAMKTTRALWLIPLLLLGLTLLMAQPGWAQDAQPALSILQVDDSQYPQMKVLVTVADANGIPIQGLDKNAFLVTEDGRAAAIQQVTAVQGAAPLNLVLAIDVSGSMKGKPMDTTRQAVAQLLGNLSPQDKAGLLIFNQKVRELAPLGSDPNTLLAAVQSLQADGDTALYDAIHEAVMRVKNAPVGRRAVVVFSDGEDTRSGLTLEDAISTAQRFSVPVYVVGYGPKIQPKQLQRIAQLTGGAFFRAPKLEDIPTAFAQVMNALNQAYEITYLGVTPVDDGEHELRVILTLAGQSVEESAPFVARAGNIALQLNLGQLPDRGAAEAVWQLMDMPPLDAQTPLLSGDILVEPQTQPGKPTRATILLDDQPLASDIQPPYTWDTRSVEPGQHTLTVQVWDHVGNEASVEQPVAVVPIAFAKLTQPAATLDMPPTVVITGVVPVQFEIATIVPLTEAIVTHQDVELARFSGPPYQFNWDVTAIPTGETQLNLALAFQDGESMTYAFPVT